MTQGVLGGEYSQKDYNGDVHYSVNRGVKPIMQMTLSSSL